MLELPAAGHFSRIPPADVNGACTIVDTGSLEPGSPEHMATEKQEAILEFIRTFQERENVPPSSRQLATAFGFRSQTTVMRHLSALAGENRIEQHADGRWGVRRAAAVQTQFADIPVYGSIPAGSPASREQQPEGLLPLAREALGSPRGTLWAVRVHGDSMIGEHIAEGDIAVFERREPQSGDIIAALVDGSETTLKKYLLESGRAVLRAANPRYPDILPGRLESQGVLVALFRRTV
jgi:repressor LexA